MLQSTLAFASFRLPASRNVDAGFSAYDTLFDNAERAGQADALYTLRQTINDYLFLVQGRFGDVKLQSDERTEITLGKAWTAYASALRQEAKVKPKYIVSEPMWVQAIQATNLPEGFDAIVEKTLAVRDVPKTFALYKAAVTVFEESKPLLALELLRQARPLLSLEDLNDAGWYFGILVDILEKQATRDDKGQVKPFDKGKLAEAITAQNDMVQMIGTGHSRLAELRYKAGDEKALASLVAQLNAVNSPESEVVAAGQMLARRYREEGKAGKLDEKLSSLQVDLLTKYFAAPRERDVANELRVRYMIALTYRFLHQPEAARAVLKTEHLVIPPTGRARYESKAVQQLLQSLEKTEN